MYEHRHQPLLDRIAFCRRMLDHGGIVLVVIAVSLTIGTLGYHLLEGQAWIDSLLNASMLLGGMGPVGELHTVAGKLFASAYALYSGLVVLILAGILLAPVFHRFLHRFHLDQDS